MKDILVFTGDGVGSVLLKHILTSLSRWLAHRFDIKRVDARMLAEEPWTESAAMLVMPGGRDLPYVKQLSGKANRRIRQYIENGGSYLGLCAGAYYACRRVEFEVATPYEVTGPRELALFAGTGRGSAYPGFVYDSQAGARTVGVSVDTSALVDLSQSNVQVYFDGGCWFDPDDLNFSSKTVRPLGWYTEGVSAGKIAIVECHVGQGLAILSGVHIEYDSALEDQQSSLFPLLSEDSVIRGLLLRSVLRRFGLKTSDIALENPPLADMALLVNDQPPSSPEAEQLWSKIRAGLAASPEELRRIGTGDTSAEIMFVEAPLNSSRSSFPQQSQSTANDSVRVINVYRCESVPQDLTETSFDSKLYYEHRRKLDQQQQVPNQLGRYLLYGEVVTSTQTILERNVGFLQSLPDGFVCLAARQVSGRGRGQNSWVSSSGCLQFSMVLRHVNPSTLVFIQYIMALAVVEAIKSKPGYQNVDIAIKWPNDIYSREVQTDGSPILRKIGGVLINSNWINGQFLLVIGCGVNLHNSEPTDCVNDAIGRHNAHFKSVPLELIRKEEVLARILFTFDDLYKSLCDSNGFNVLLPLYYQRWLHSGQRVVLEDFGKVEAVIEGISDQGLLLTRSLANPNEVFEHQPDGNSFDLMKNMIVRKKQ